MKNFISEKAGIFLLDKMKNTRVKYYLELYKSSLYWSKDKIESYQVKRIHELLEYAYDSSPFYKKRFNDAGFNYEKFRYLDQLKNIPPLTRKDIQENLNNIVSRYFDLEKCKKGSSSGSSGHPVIYYHDSDDFSASRAAGIFSKILGGYKLGDKWLNIWGNPTAVNIEWKKLNSRISKIIFNECRFPAYKLSTEKTFKKLAKLVLTKKPEFIYGYTNAIFLLSDYIRKNSIKIDFIRGVFTTAENLHSYQRINIGKYLGKVYDQYGSSEINGIAAETLYNEAYYIIAPHVFVEYGDIVDKEVGTRKLMITGFDNKVLPFIRYENGDLGVPYENKSNPDINYPEMKSVEGRVSDIIRLPGGGSLVVPSFFGSRMLKNVNGITRYQIVKRTENKIEINLLTNDDFKDVYKGLIFSTLDEYIPSELKYELVFNQQVITSENNKFKLFVDMTAKKK